MVIERSPTVFVLQAKDARLSSAVIFATMRSDRTPGILMNILSKHMNRIFKNPYLNSIYAEIYIVLVVSILHGVSAPNTPDTFFDPIAAISLFVLSAAVMGYLFLGEPLQLYLDGKMKEAVAFFMRTVMSFAVITAIAFVIVSRVLR